MATEHEQSIEGINDDAYFSALSPGKTIDRSKLKEILRSVTPGGENTLLHLAASVGNLDFIVELLNAADPDVKALLLKATNAEKDTALHLAAQGGFSEVVKTLLEQQGSVVDVRNKLGETALFKAYESGNLDTVMQLLGKCPSSLLESPSSLLERTEDKRTCLIVAVNRGDSKLVDHILNLRQTTVDKGTCLTVAVNRGNSALVDHIINPSNANIAEELIRKKDELGNTALHIAVGRNYVDIIQKLIKFDPKLCYCVNLDQETPLFMAAKLGHLEAIKELIKARPDAVEIRNSGGMNVLHIAAQVNQVRIVECLYKTVGLSHLVNKGVDPPEDKPQKTGENRGAENPSEDKPQETGGSRVVDKPQETGGKGDPALDKDPLSKIRKGDTPLHIAARQKSYNMVNLLLKIRGINKFAVNKAGLTAFDIVRENTEYHESDEIIAVLANYPSKHKPFLYSSPKVSPEKHEVAIKTVDKTFEDRRNTELVVAVLLATMSFTAAFTVPGGFVEGGNPAQGSSGGLVPAPSPGGSVPAPSPQAAEPAEGSPLLLGLDSFKVFLIFDCVAFFLSLFVVLMWQMSTPITTGNKVLFLCITNLLVCSSFAFTAYGFMLAVYSMLDRQNHELAWFILGACLIICGCCNVTFFYMVAKFFVKKARFNYLNGLLLDLPDCVAEYVWMKLERSGYLDLVRGCKGKWLAIFYCICLKKDVANNESYMAKPESTKKAMAKPKSGSGEPITNEDGAHSVV